MTTFKANRKFPNPITVTDDPKSHTLALQQVIEALNIGQRRTKEINSSYVRVHELVDVGLVEIVGNQLKLTNAGTAAVAAGASALADLTDVDLTGLADGDTLVWDSGAGMWVPGAASSGPITGADMYDVSLNDLADVGFSDPQDGDALVYDASTGMWTIGEATYSPVDDGALLRNSGTQTIATSTDTPVVFNTEVRDDGGYADLGVNTSRLTIPTGKAGWYVIAGVIYWDASTAGFRVLRLCKNGANEATEICADVRTDSGGYVQQNVSAVVYLAAGDYVQLVAWHNSGSNRTLNVTNNMPSLAIHRLGVASSPSNPVNDGVQLRRTGSAQSIPHSTITAVQWDTEDRDDGNYWTSGSNTRITFANAGWYLVGACIDYEANTTSVRYLITQKNGTMRITQDSQDPASSGVCAITTSTVHYFAAGDYIEFMCFQASGSARTLITTDGFPRAWAHRLGTPESTETVNDQFFDPSTRHEYFNDFIGTDHATDDGWITNVISGGSVTQSSEDKHPGTIVVATATNNAAYAITNLAPINGSVFTAEPMFFTPTGSDELFLEICFKVNTLFNASPNPGAYRIGFINQVTSYTEFCYLDMGNGAANFAVRNAGANVSTALSTAPVAGTWHRLKFKLTASMFSCYLDDVLVASTSDTTKFPTAGFTVFLFVQNQGGTGVNHALTADYVRVWGTTTRN